MTKDPRSQKRQTTNDERSSLPIIFGGEELVLLADRAVYWPAREILFITDTHFGKDSSMRSMSIPMPDILESELLRVDNILRSTGAKSLIVLGDFYHDAESITELQTKLIADFTRSHSQVGFSIIRGNHDLKSGDPRLVTGIVSYDPPCQIGPLTLLHDPADAGHEGYFLAGHLHPGVSLRVSRKERVSMPAFSIKDNVIILPAFGRLTGKGGLRRKANGRIVGIADGELIEI